MAELFSSGPVTSPELIHVRRRAIEVRMGSPRPGVIFDVMQYCEVDYATARELLESQLRYLDTRDAQRMVQRSILHAEGSQAE